MKSLKFIIPTVIAVVGTTLPVQAITLITNRNDVSGNDQLNWSSVGKIFDPLAPNPSAFLSNSFTASSDQGLSVGVNIPVTNGISGITPPFVFQTSAPPKGIPTNFALNDYILFTGFVPGKAPTIGNPGPLTFTFAQPVKEVGTQIAVDDTSNFTASVSAFDKNNKLLGTFSVPGVAGVDFDNSSPFLGVSSDEFNIAKIVYSSSESNRALGVNQLSINGIPEPKFYLSFLALSLFVVSKKRRS